MKGSPIYVGSTEATIKAAIIVQLGEYGLVTLKVTSSILVSCVLFEPKNWSNCQVLIELAIGPVIYSAQQWSQFISY